MAIKASAVVQKKCDKILLSTHNVSSSSPVELDVVACSCLLLLVFHVINPVYLIKLQYCTFNSFMS